MIILLWILDRNVRRIKRPLARGRRCVCLYTKLLINLAAPSVVGRCRFLQVCLSNKIRPEYDDGTNLRTFKRLTRDGVLELKSLRRSSWQAPGLKITLDSVVVRGAKLPDHCPIIFESFTLPICPSSSSCGRERFLDSLVAIW